MGPWVPPAERGPSLESIYRVSLTVDLCEGNKIVCFKTLFHHSQLVFQKIKRRSAFGCRDVVTGEETICASVTERLTSFING